MEEVHAHSASEFPYGERLRAEEVVQIIGRYEKLETRPQFQFSKTVDCLAIVAIHGHLASGLRDNLKDGLPVNVFIVELLHELRALLPHDLQVVVDYNARGLMEGGGVALPLIEPEDWQKREDDLNLMNRNWCALLGLSHQIDEGMKKHGPIPRHEKSSDQAHVILQRMVHAVLMWATGSHTKCPPFTEILDTAAEVGIPIVEEINAKNEGLGPQETTPSEGD